MSEARPLDSFEKQQNLNAHAASKFRWAIGEGIAAAGMIPGGLAMFFQQSTNTAVSLGKWLLALSQQCLVLLLCPGVPPTPKKAYY